MTFTEAAAEVLRMAGKPLHYKEINELAIEKNLLSHVGKSPEVTMGARLAALLKKEDKQNPIVRVKPGVFALREWDGKKIPIVQLRAALEEPDREHREKAWKLMAERRMQDTAALDRVWTGLLGLRLKIAANAGFPDYRSYRWRDLKRFDYTPEDAQEFDRSVEEVVVPVVAAVVKQNLADFRGGMLPRLKHNEQRRVGLKIGDLVGSCSVFQSLSQILGDLITGSKRSTVRQTLPPGGPASSSSMVTFSGAGPTPRCRLSRVRDRDRGRRALGLHREPEGGQRGRDRRSAAAPRRGRAGCRRPAAQPGAPPGRPRPWHNAARCWG